MLPEPAPRTLAANLVRTQPPATESDLQHGELDPRCPEQLESRRGRTLEERRWAAEHAAFDEGLNRFLYGCDRGTEGTGLDFAAIDDEALLETHQMGRGIARHPVAGRTKRRLHHYRDRALAVRAGDQDR